MARGSIHQHIPPEIWKEYLYCYPHWAWWVGNTDGIYPRLVPYSPMLSQPPSPSQPTSSLSQPKTSSSWWDLFWWVGVLFINITRAWSLLSTLGFTCLGLDAHALCITVKATGWPFTSSLTYWVPSERCLSNEFTMTQVEMIKCRQRYSTSNFSICPIEYCHCWWPHHPQGTSGSLWPCLCGPLLPSLSK